MRAGLKRRVVRIAASFRAVTVAPMLAGRDLALLTDVADCQRRDGPPELVVRRKYSVIPMPVLPRRRDEIGEPVQKLKRRELDECDHWLAMEDGTLARFAGHRGRYRLSAQIFAIDRTGRLANTSDSCVYRDGNRHPRSTSFHDDQPQNCWRIGEVFADQGDTIEEGQLLIQLDDEELQQQVETAQASLEASRAALQRVMADMNRAIAVFEQSGRHHARMQSLKEKKATTQEVVDQAVESLAIATADVNRAEAAITEGQKGVLAAEKTLEYHRARLADTTIKGPFGGLVVDRQREGLGRQPGVRGR